MNTYWSTSSSEKTARQFVMENTGKDGVVFEIQLKAGLFAVKNIQ